MMTNSPLPEEAWVARNGRPMAPPSIMRRAVWMPGPSTVSGAQPSNSPASSACVASAAPDFMFGSIPA